MDEQKKENLITLKIGGEELAFIIDKENYSELNINNIQQYTPEIAALVNISTQVRQRSPFGDCDAVIENIKKDYANTFRPFDFQVENVKTMLKRFEGNGVFGDQVGLGKTVEALLSALVMFRCGAIKNALVVATSKTKDNWANEAMRFSNAKGASFEVISDKSFEAVLKDIQEEYGKAQKPPYKIYVITDDEWMKINSHTENISKRADNIVKMDDNKVDAEFEKMCDKLIAEFKDHYDTVELREVLEKHGWDLDNNLSKFTPAELSEMYRKVNLSNLNDAQYQCLLNKLNGCLVDLGNSWGLIAKVSLRNRGFYNAERTVRERLDMLENVDRNEKDWIDRFRDAYGEIENKRKADLAKFKEDKDDVFVKLLQGRNNEQARIAVDLLIVDEVHQFFNNVKMKTDSREAYSGEDKTNLKKLLLARVPRRYCILISATPVRKSLEDIFYLTYIANPSRYGIIKDDSNEEAKEAQDYFYHTICRIPEGAEANRRLSFMVRNEDARSGLVGMINSIFTRKRIHEISSQVKWSEGNCYDFVLNTHSKKSIEEALRIISLQSGLNVSDDDIDEMLKMLKSGRNNNEDESHFAAFDLGMMKLYDAHRESPDSDPAISVEKYHKLIDWRRHDKAGCGIAVPSLDMAVIKEFKKRKIKEFEDRRINTSEIEALCIADLLILKKLLEMFDTANRNDFWGNTSNFLDISAPNGKPDMVKRKLCKALQNDAVIIYVSSVHLRSALKDCLNLLYDGTRKVSIFSAENSNWENAPATVTAESYNRITITDQGEQAGVNFQQYGTLIFAQLDDMGQRILEPLDIEQWVGRIYRTGQVRSCCHIATLVTTDFNWDKKKPFNEDNYSKADYKTWKTNYDADQDFLREYYNEYLSNSDALDLYGKGRPEIGFIQPIIADYIRYIYEQLIDKRIYVENTKDNKINLDLRVSYGIKGSDINKVDGKYLSELNFAKLIKLVFTTMVKEKKVLGNGNASAYEQFKKHFKELCHLKEFCGADEE